MPKVVPGYKEMAKEKIIDSASKLFPSDLDIVKSDIFNRDEMIKNLGVENKR